MSTEQRSDDMVLKFLKTLLLRVKSIDERLSRIEGTVPCHSTTRVVAPSQPAWTDDISISGLISPDPGRPGGKDLEILASQPVFKGLTEAELLKVMGCLRRVSYPKGTVVFEEGTLGRSMFIIRDGGVKIVKRSDGRDHFITLLEKGTTLGEMAFVDGEYRSATAIAQTDVDLFEMDGNLFVRMATTDLEIVNKILKGVLGIVNSRLRFSNEHYAFDFKIKVRQEVLSFGKMGDDLVELIVSMEEA